jgi:hypothetical protein
MTLQFFHPHGPIYSAIQPLNQDSVWTLDFPTIIWKGETQMIWKFQQCQAPEKQELIYIYDDIMIVMNKHLIL